jgi:hypothetical protein
MQTEAPGEPTIVRLARCLGLYGIHHEVPHGRATTVRFCGVSSSLDREDLSRQRQAVDRARTDLAEALALVEQEAKVLRRAVQSNRPLANPEQFSAARGPVEEAANDAMRAADTLWQALFDLSTASGEDA